LCRVKDIYANYIELDLTNFTTSFCHIQHPIIATLHEGSYQKLPKLFQVFGCWSECEMYKVFFFQHSHVLTNIIKLVENPRITIQMFEYVTELLRSLSQFHISDQNSEKYNLKDVIGKYLKGLKINQDSVREETTFSFKLVSEQDDRKFNLMSKLGVALIKTNLNQILESLTVFSELVYKSAKLQNLTKSQMKRIFILMSEFAMFIAYFCESSNEHTQM
jgi:hypothetical protein